MYVAFGYAVMIIGGPLAFFLTYWFAKHDGIKLNSKQVAVGIAGTSILSLVIGFGWLIPFEKRAQAMHDIAAQSVEAKFAVDTFNDCRHPGAFNSNPAAFCRNMVVELSAKQHGKVFADKATVAVDALVEQL